MDKISIELNNIDFSYEQDAMIFKNFSLKIDNGIKIGLYGPSGSGKSTLLSLMSGLLIPLKGSILWKVNETVYKNKEINKIRAQYSSFMLQHHFLLNYLNLKENILLAFPFNPSNDHIERCDELISTLGLSKCKNRLPKNLSGGEKQRTALGRTLVNEKGLIFVDEPTARLDRKNARDISDLLISVLKDQTVVFASHDEYLLDKCDRLVNIGNLK